MSNEQQVIVHPAGAISHKCPECDGIHRSLHQDDEWTCPDCKVKLTPVYGNHHRFFGGPLDGQRSISYGGGPPKIGGTWLKDRHRPNPCCNGVALYRLDRVELAEDTGESFDEQCWEFVRGCIAHDGAYGVSS